MDPSHFQGVKLPTPSRQLIFWLESNWHSDECRQRGNSDSKRLLVQIRRHDGSLGHSPIDTAGDLIPSLRQEIWVTFLAEAIHLSAALFAYWRLFGTSDYFIDIGRSCGYLAYLRRPVGLHCRQVKTDELSFRRDTGYVPSSGVRGAILVNDVQAAASNR